MKKTALISLVASLLLAGAPLASAQSYYPSYPAAYPSNSYGTASYGCIALTAYQSFGSTDAATGGQVTMLQQFLNSTGYLSGVSGYFDNGTYGAVVNYQSSHGIQPTGTVGPQTRSAINAQSCSSSSYNSNPGYTTYPYNNYGTNYNNGYPYNNGSYYSAPTITSLSTTAGQPGTSVTIYGNFGGPLPTVHFGGQTVSANLNSNSSLTFTVPSYSTGSYSVYVSNSYGSSNSLSFSVTSYGNCNSSYANYNNSYGYNGGNYSYQNCNCSSYNIYPIVYGYNSSYNSGSNCGSNYNNGYGSGAQPQLSSITGPSTVSAGSSYSWSVSSYAQNGDPVTVSIDWGDGTQYQSSQYGTSNQSFSFSHSYVSNGTFTMRVTATDSTTGAYSYSTLSVTVNGYGYNNGYPYNNGSYYNQPSISYLSSTSGYPGNTITVYGNGFSGNSVVYFGNSAYTPSAMTDSSIIIQVPYVANGTYPVSVRNGSGSSSNSVSFSVY